MTAAAPGAGPGGRMLRALLVDSPGAPVEVVGAIEAALDELGLEVRRVGVGRVGPAHGAARMVQALRGDPEGRRLERELETTAPDVAVAFEAGAAAALASLRDRRLAHLALDPSSQPLPAPVVAIVPELAPGRAWTTDVDRYAVVDDEAAVTLAEGGVDGARVLAVGPPVGAAWAQAARLPAAAARASVAPGASDELDILLVDTRGLGRELVTALSLQLGLLARPPLVLFDIGGDGDVASLLREQAPRLGLRAKMFGRSSDAPRYWRAADVVLGRPTARAVHAALALGATFAALEPQGEAALAEARALVERGLGAIVDRTLLAAASLEPLLASRAARQTARARASGDGAVQAARLIAGVAADREAVLVETLESQGREPAPGVAEEPGRRPAAAKRPPAAEPPTELEDLGEGDLGQPGFGAAPDAADRAGPPPGKTSVPPAGPRRTAGTTAGPASAELDRVRAELDAAAARARREMDDARVEAERWERRRDQASASGDRALAERAAREADRKRARMHTALDQLGRIDEERRRLGGAGRPAGGPPPPRRGSLDEMLDELKRRAREQEGSLDDALRELKRRMRAEEKGRR